jgi:hypothetical protein
VAQEQLKEAQEQQGDGKGKGKAEDKDAIIAAKEELIQSLRDQIKSADETKQQQQQILDAIHSRNASAGGGSSAGGGGSSAGGGAPIVWWTDDGSDLLAGLEDNSSPAFHSPAIGTGAGDGVAGGAHTLGTGGGGGGSAGAAAAGGGGGGGRSIKFRDELCRDFIEACATKPNQYRNDAKNFALTTINADEFENDHPGVRAGLRNWVKEPNKRNSKDLLITSIPALEWALEFIRRGKHHKDHDDLVTALNTAEPALRARLAPAAAAAAAPAQQTAVASAQQQTAAAAASPVEQHHL